MGTLNLTGRGRKGREGPAGESPLKPETKLSHLRSVMG